MSGSNPFTITFGKRPNTQINRYEDIDIILSTFTSENPVSQTFLIEGIRGSGKTVLMTTVAAKLGANKDWAVINLNPAMDLISSLALRLNDACGTAPELLSKGFNVSAAGFGLGINPAEKTTDYIGLIDKCFKKIIKTKKKVLITIDEVINDDNMKIFASQFQIMVRQDYPVFLIMTGLHENIFEIQNNPSLTFLLRSPKIVTGPLSIVQIIQQYEDIFKIDEQKAEELAGLTYGYAFAFQALGVAYWNHGKEGMKAVLAEYDGLLDDFVYKKIWSSLSGRERDIVRAIGGAETKTGDILKNLSMTASTFSKYRDLLIDKGIIISEKYGHVSLALPRFYEITKRYKR